MSTRIIFKAFKISPCDFNLVLYLESQTLLGQMSFQILINLNENTRPEYFLACLHNIIYYATNTLECAHPHTKMCKYNTALHLS